MNRVIIMGRLTKDPEFTQTESTGVAKYTLAVDRRKKDSGADFVPCVCFGKGAEFARDYLKKGIKICIAGHVQTGSYTNQEGKKVYTVEIVAEEQEFAESKKEFHPVEEGEELPFA